MSYSNENSGVWIPMTTSPSSRYAREPRAHVWLLTQPVDAGQRPEVHEDDLAVELVGADRLGVEPRGRPRERRPVQTLKQAHLCVYRPAGSRRSLWLPQSYLGRRPRRVVGELHGGHGSLSRLGPHPRGTAFRRRLDQVVAEPCASAPVRKQQGRAHGMSRGRLLDAPRRSSK
jgi:hypothetical protein